MAEKSKKKNDFLEMEAMRNFYTVIEDRAENAILIYFKNFPQ